MTAETCLLQVKHSMLYHTARAMAISWSPDSKLVVSGGIDTNICIWNAENGRKISDIKGKEEMTDRRTLPDSLKDKSQPLLISNGLCGILDNYIKRLVVCLMLYQKGLL